MSETPLSQLVLWVPPAVAAGWEHLSERQRTWWTQELTHFWLALITAPGPPPVLLQCGLLRSKAQYDAARRDLDAALASLPPPPRPQENRHG